MKLKKSNKNTLYYKIQLIIRSKVAFITLVISILTIISLYLGIYLGIHINRTGQYVLPEEWIKGVARNTFSFIPNYVSSVGAETHNITIDIKHKHYQSLTQNRELALHSGYIFQEFMDEVPATIRYLDKSLNVNISLSGNDIEDWEEKDQWSFNISLLEEKTLFGISKFTLQRPKADNYLNEWFFHKLLKYNKFINLKYIFIHVILNGKDYGIYTLKEDFERKLLDRNKRKEGLIVRFDDYLFSIDKREFRYDDTYLSSQIKPISNKLKKESYQMQFDIAKNLLFYFKNDSLKASEVFNIKKMAKLFALIDLMGQHRELSYHSLRFYYNPITSKLEPIGYNNSVIKKSSENKLLCESLETAPLWINQFFSDESFVNEYYKALNEVSKKSYLKFFLEKIEEDKNNQLKILYKSYPWYEFLGSDLLHENQKYIKKVLNPVTAVQAFVNKQPDSLLTLLIGNIQSAPLEIIGLNYKDKVLLKPANKFKLSSKEDNRPVDYKNISFLIPKDFEWTEATVKNLKLIYKLPGTNILKSTQIYKWAVFNENFLRKDIMRKSSNIYDFDFLEINDVSKKIVVKKGKWVIDNNLIIPAGYKVFASKGVEFDLIKSSKIISYSAIIFMGSEEKPIKIYSSDSTGQGIAVMKTKNPSVLSYVNFENLHNPRYNLWELPGMLTFYESTVKIYACYFEKCKSKEIISIVRSLFEIDKSVFSFVPSDAIDIEFSKGKITNTYIANCKKYGIDISDSELFIDNLNIMRAQKAGLNIEANSIVNIDEIEIDLSDHAIICTDMAQCFIKKLRLTACKTGIKAYQKRQEYGPASVFILYIKHINVEKLADIEQKSNLFIESKSYK